MENIMQSLKVVPVKSPQGNFVKNQYVIFTAEGKFFQSYEDTVAFIPADPLQKTILDEKYWDGSPTTLRYLEEFLMASHGKILVRIDQDEYIMGHLNEENFLVLT